MRHRGPPFTNIGGRWLATSGVLEPGRRWGPIVPATTPPGSILRLPPHFCFSDVFYPPPSFSRIWCYDRRKLICTHAPPTPSCCPLFCFYVCLLGLRLMHLINNPRHRSINANSLTALPANVFSTLGSLGTLMLDNNQMTTLPLGLFGGTPNIKLLYVSIPLLLGFCGAYHV